MLSFPSLRLPSALLVAFLAASCDRATDPDAGPAREVEIRLTALGDTARLFPAGRGSASVAEETRYIVDRQVIEIEAGLARALAPGATVFRVEEEGARPTRVTIRVELAGPTIIGMESQPTPDGDDHFLVSGYRLDRVDLSQLRLDGGPVQATLRDSSAILVRAAPLAQTADCSAAPRSSLSAPGVEVRAEATARRRRVGEISFAVGEVRRMSAAEIACLRLARGDATAEYALAYVDPSQIRAAETAPETSRPGYALRVEHLDPITTPVPAKAAATRMPLDRMRGPHVLTEEEYERRRCDVFWEEFRPMECTPTRLSVGDRYEWPRSPSRPPEFHRVVHVDGHVVFMIPEADSVRFNPGMLATLRNAMLPVREIAEPLLRAVYAGRDPVTSSSSGQLYIFLRDQKSFTLCGACIVQLGYYSATEAGEVPEAMSFSLGYMVYQYLESGEASVASTLAHELTHAWQGRYSFDTRPARVGSPHVPTWAMEGVASFLAAETMRRWVGIAPDANLRTDASPYTTPTGQYANLAGGGVGFEFSQGYTPVASFLQDLAVRRMRSGEPWETAVRETARGVVEGWHGYLNAEAGSNGPRPFRTQGLTARTRASLGSGWDPVEAMLRWTLANAIDDLTTNPAYQNESFLRAGTSWTPNGRFRTGSGVVEATPFLGASNTASKVEMTRTAGGTGYLMIEDRGKGGTYEIRASRPDLEWVVARYR